MQKDLKIGMLAGLALVFAVLLWLSTRPILTTNPAMPQPYSRDSQQEFTERSLHTVEAAAGIESPAGATAGFALREGVQKIKTQRFHIVRRGETLSGISRSYYGSANKWSKIYNANRLVLKDANRIAPGTKLIIPK